MTKMLIKVSNILTFASLLVFVLAACTGRSEVLDEISDANTQLQIYSQNQSQEIYNYSVEREVLQSIVEARVKSTNTYTFFFAPMTPRPVFSCPSLGFPIAATAQATNPEQFIRGYGGSYFDSPLPQIEPSGIYAPPDTDATYSVCLLDNGNVAPIYWEPNIASFPFPVVWVDNEFGGNFEVVGNDQVPSLLPSSAVTIQFEIKDSEVREVDPDSPNADS